MHSTDVLSGWGTFKRSRGAAVQPCPPAHFCGWLVGDELRQAPSQVTKVTNLDVQDLDDAPHLHFRLSLLLLAGGQRLLSILDLTLQLGVSSLHILWKKPRNTDHEWSISLWAILARGSVSALLIRLQNSLMKTPRQVCLDWTAFLHI